MNCEEACVVAALAASGDASPAELCAFETHTTSCAACRAEGAGFETLRRQLCAMQDAKLPDSAYAAVRARVISEIDAGRHRRRRWILAGASLAVAAACSIGALAPHRTVPIEVLQAPVAPTVIASAPVPAASHRIRRVVRRKVAREPEAPIVVKMFTSDPDVVIYWVADAKVQSSKREIVQ